MDNQDYNYQKHKELIDYKNSLKNQNKFLKNVDKFKYSELKRYDLQINEYFHWSQRHKYLQLIEDFLSFKITGKEFDNQFCKLVKEVEKACRFLLTDDEVLKKIKSKQISFDFARWISEIYLCCDEFYPDFDSQDPPDFPFAKNEDQLRASVNDILPEIQKYF